MPYALPFPTQMMVAGTACHQTHFRSTGKASGDDITYRHRPSHAFTLWRRRIGLDGQCVHGNFGLI